MAELATLADIRVRVRHAFLYKSLPEIKVRVDFLVRFVCDDRPKSSTHYKPFRGQSSEPICWLLIAVLQVE